MLPMIRQISPNYEGWYSFNSLLPNSGIRKTKHLSSVVVWWWHMGTAKTILFHLFQPLKKNSIIETVCLDGTWSKRSVFFHVSSIATGRSCALGKDTQCFYEDHITAFLVHHNCTKHYGSDTLNNSPLSRLIMSYCFTWLSIFGLFVGNGSGNIWFHLFYLPTWFTHTKKPKQRKVPYFLRHKIIKTLWEE